jgi:hypothetical protein
MKLRIQPWFTHGCITFLNNVFKWYPQLCGTTPSVLEWGGGNSTLYFLTKKCNVLTVESDEGYVKELAALASAMGFRTAVVSNTTEAMERFDASDLVILHAKGYQDVGDSIFQCRDWTFLLNDGISRKDVLEAVSRLTFQGVLILDNLEYCANWGRLERAAAHPDRVRLYRQFLRDPAWRQLLFEQQEGRNGHSTPDSTGWEAPHRWISGVLWRQEHLFTQLLVTHAGLPVVTPDALGDRDLETLSERCPFDWQQMKWLVDEYSNVFTLDRSFE